MTYAFTKYAGQVLIQIKEADTVKEAIFSEFCVPLDLITNQGTEFCAMLSKDHFSWLGTSNLTTLSDHLQCNSQPEVANKTIDKYLATFCDSIQKIIWYCSCFLMTHPFIASSKCLCFSSHLGWSCNFQTCQYLTCTANSMENQLRMTSFSN